ncbi:hydrophilic surface protein 2 [Leishmania mexicana MHOM/GT/2001/U1103]|uniref:Hydrophilic surface protein 2 n=1 Tax=Leishmania mexicana (strain MHOM/GT/2001/U1103) TaxID=929439 RepID=E9AWB9_LEIMU|nr:hydrophilic surface protein 2 [Leishmania mexicana MHOM/GT/2001/U1103]CBZ27254.1 hydrophilic surface protein 2 [Leishmania mexicana MHOM/GT/2001/U1103]
MGMGRRTTTMARKPMGMRATTRVNTTWVRGVTATGLVMVITRRRTLPPTSALRPGLCVSGAVHPTVGAPSEMYCVCPSRFISLSRAQWLMPARGRCGCTS